MVGGEWWGERLAPHPRAGRANESWRQEIGDHQRPGGVRLGADGPDNTGLISTAGRFSHSVAAMVAVPDEFPQTFFLAVLMRGTRAAESRNVGVFSLGHCTHWCGLCRAGCSRGHEKAHFC